MIDPPLYLHVYENSQGEIFCLELAPVPTTPAEARTAFLEHDAFWCDYKYTVKVEGTAAQYLNTASDIAKDATRSRPDDAQADLSDADVWRLERAALRFRPPQYTDPLSARPCRPAPGSGGALA